MLLYRPEYAKLIADILRIGNQLAAYGIFQCIDYPDVAARGIAGAQGITGCTHHYLEFDELVSGLHRISSRQRRNFIELENQVPIQPLIGDERYFAQSARKLMERSYSVLQALDARVDRPLPHIGMQIAGCYLPRQLNLRFCAGGNG